jgi:hypothetical protein
MPNKKTNPSEEAKPQRVVTIVYDNQDHLGLCEQTKKALMNHFTLPENNFKLCFASSGHEDVSQNIVNAHKSPCSMLILYVKTVAGITNKYATRVSDMLKGSKVHQYGLQLRGNPADISLRNEESLPKLILHAQNYFKH